MEKPLSRRKIESAFAALDVLVPRPIRLIMGGGGAMIMAHGFPLATSDVDAIPLNASIEELDPLVKHVARDLGLPPDWLNPYFSTFSHVLPGNYGLRLKTVYSGSRLTVDALGAEDMLIMKCFAGRAKDVAHARALVKGGAKIKIVENRLEELRARAVPGAARAFDFLDDVIEGHDERP